MTKLSSLKTGAFISIVLYMFSFLFLLCLPLLQVSSSWHRQQATTKLRMRKSDNTKRWQKRTVNKDSKLIKTKRWHRRKVENRKGLKLTKTIRWQNSSYCEEVFMWRWLVESGRDRCESVCVCLSSVVCLTQRVLTEVLLKPVEKIRVVVPSGTGQ